MRIAHCMINIIFLYVESESLHEDSSLYDKYYISM